MKLAKDGDVAATKAALELRAAELSDGHLTIMRFTTNWRVWFGTPGDRGEIQAAPKGRTFQEAAWKALLAPPSLFRADKYCWSCGSPLPPYGEVRCRPCADEDRPAQRLDLDG
jgi:hypothetical protein